MDYSIIANLATVIISDKVNGASQKEVKSSSAINIPGTLVGNLATVVNTKNYMDSYERYNNYLTSNLGAAQMAADRYMSLKERVPMSVEYYVTPTQRKSVTMYINPEKMSIATQKVEAKVYTRGGIYYNQYGDDHWTMSLHGTVGYAQMRGVEALEEIYHNSGTLLKFQNISASTVHTNQITTLATGGSSSSSKASGTSVDSLLSSLTGSNSPVSKYVGRVLSTATDAIGITGDGKNSLASKLGLTDASAKKASSKSNNNLFSAVATAALGAYGAYTNTVQVASATTGLQQMMTAASAVTGDATNFKGLYTAVATQLKNGMSTTASSITQSIAADLVASVIAGSPKNENLSKILQQLNGGTTSGLTTILNVLNGNFSQAVTSAIPQQATSGNYYTLGQMTATELNSVVGTVQAFNNSKTIDKSKAASNWADIQDQLTDPYRPRQVLIYFEDRVYIGHFTSFQYDRSAAVPLIYYDMKFVVTRMVKLTSTSASTTGTSGGNSSTASLSSMLKTAAIGAAVDSIFKK